MIALDLESPNLKAMTQEGTLITELLMPVAFVMGMFLAECVHDNCPKEPTPSLTRMKALHSLSESLCLKVSIPD